MLIPASFKLDRRPCSVSLVRHTQPTGTMGKVYYELRLIEIATHSGRNQRQFTRKELTDTFWREVTHAILRGQSNRSGSVRTRSFQRVWKCSQPMYSLPTCSRL
jgi:hypothetical protein